MLNPFVDLAIIAMVMVFRLALSIVRGLMRIIVAIFGRPAMWLSAKVNQGIVYCLRQLWKGILFVIRKIISGISTLAEAAWSMSMKYRTSKRKGTLTQPDNTTAQFVSLDSEEIMAVDRDEYEADMARLAPVSPLAGYDMDRLSMEAVRINPTFLNPSVN